MILILINTKHNIQKTGLSLTTWTGFFQDFYLADFRQLKAIIRLFLLAAFFKTTTSDQQFGKIIVSRSGLYNVHACQDTKSEIFR